MLGVCQVRGRVGGVNLLVFGQGPFGKMPIFGGGFAGGGMGGWRGKRVHLDRHLSSCTFKLPAGHTAVRLSGHSDHSAPAPPAQPRLELKCPFGCRHVWAQREQQNTTRIRCGLKYWTFQTSVLLYFN